MGGMVWYLPVQARKALRETRDTRGACATERATSYGMEKIGSNACLVVLLHLVLSPLRVTHRYAGVIRMTGDVMSHNRVEHHICTHTQNCPVYVSLIQGLQLHYHTANYYQRHTQLLVWTTTEAIVPLVSHLSSCSVELRPHQ